MADADIVLSTAALTMPWETADPFLFCAYHRDDYPASNGRLGPAESLAGRNIGSDFSGRDGWSMYHGTEVPGFPAHPHRGFETITVVRQGLIDHTDSTGAAARFGPGDVQWITAGGGVVHAEMFPLLHADRDNPTELFQIWLNLPPDDKMADPHFAMFWANDVPRPRFEDAAGRQTTVTVVAGALGGAAPLAPPPHSWAARPESEVAVWTADMEAGAEWTVPASPAGLWRCLYVFGGEVSVGGVDVPAMHRAVLRSDGDAPVVAGSAGADLLLLQGRPIGAPVVSYGPFVMNTPSEIRQAFADYERTRFGGWPWPSPAPTHAPDRRRFARHGDGRLEEGGELP